jgi:hypothetical protein
VGVHVKNLQILIFVRKRRGKNSGFTREICIPHVPTLSVPQLNLTLLAKGQSKYWKSQVAHGIARKFSKKCNVTVTFPELHLAVMDKVSVITNIISKRRKLSSDEFVLFEPYIRGSLEYFVTCEGFVTENCPQIIEELCHFSYNDSNGTDILRGLKGVWRKDGNTFQLASPATEMFSKGSSCGSEDGMAVKNFFDSHHCTHRCEKWLSCQTQSSVNDISYMLKNFAVIGPPPPYH